jgi:peptidoglycan/xylan/chitin deacetylase (PgdA/CDA1 family)
VLRLAENAGALLIGYDTESGTGWIPERPVVSVTTSSRRWLNVFKRSMATMLKIHTEMDVPATIFICGRTLVSGTDYVRPFIDFNNLFDIEQHTYSHVLLKTVVVEDKENSAYARRPTERYVEGAPLEIIRKEVKTANRALKKYLGVTCRGIRGPYGYYRGLSDRADILKILHEEGIRFTSTYLRNQYDWQPVPMEVQPFWYELQGFPDMLEIPGQGWADCIWREIYGWTNREKYGEYLKSAVDEIRRKHLMWGTVFHDYSFIRSDPTGRLMRGLIRYARENDVKILNYAQFYEQQRNKRDIFLRQG